jgi:hypothetical protein
MKTGHNGNLKEYRTRRWQIVKMRRGSVARKLKIHDRRCVSTSSNCFVHDLHVLALNEREILPCRESIPQLFAIPTEPARRCYFLHVLRLQWPPPPSEFATSDNCNCNFPRTRFLDKWTARFPPVPLRLCQLTVPATQSVI